MRRSHKLWKPDDVQAWLYAHCKAVVDEADHGTPPTPYNDDTVALTRYDRCDPDDYDDTFQTLPGDANPLDEAIVAPAMAWNPQRRRMLRQQQEQQQGGQFHANNEEVEMQRLILEQIRRDRGATVVDPDAPLAEVFLRSMMPWATVDGVDPAARPGG